MPLLWVRVGRLAVHCGDSHSAQGRGSRRVGVEGDGWSRACAGCVLWVRLILVGGPHAHRHTPPRPHATASVHPACLGTRRPCHHRTRHARRYICHHCTTTRSPARSGSKRLCGPISSLALSSVQPCTRCTTNRHTRCERVRLADKRIALARPGPTWRWTWLPPQRNGRLRVAAHACICKQWLVVSQLGL